MADLKIIIHYRGNKNSERGLAIKRVGQKRIVYQETRNKTLRVTIEKLGKTNVNKKH